ncbi:MAG: ring-cleaving dioxygenase [Anaerolineales bacterium]|nr:ring-cleaving dioxygenase [Anaerolineales bacterium]
MKPIQGIHHITSFASDPQRNVDFYHRVLGQRLVKTTVNFDDPGTYHLYYGDEVGTPGTIMTYFPWPGARRGRVGNGEAGAVAYAIRPDSLPFWQERLAAAGISIGQTSQRFGATVLPFQDPDGMVIELITDDAPATIQPWLDGPVPADHIIQGFHSTTLNVHNAAATATLLQSQFGFNLAGQEGSRYRLAAAGNDIGQYIDLLERPGQPRGQMGAGSVHHIAFRTVDDSEQLEYLAQLRAAGVGVTDVKDRQYFRSIYFREPNGILFEVATDAPGFPYDEPVAELGHNLKLPAWLEPNRAEIQQVLPPLDLSLIR